MYNHKLVFERKRLFYTQYLVEKFKKVTLNKKTLLFEILPEVEVCLVPCLTITKSFVN